VDLIDDDGDGDVDCVDSDCKLSTPSACSVEAICDDTLDNEFFPDGLIDCADPDCQATEPACALPNEVNCFDGLDEDQDVYRDCADSDCWATIGCEGACVSTSWTLGANTFTSSSPGRFAGCGNDDGIDIAGSFTAPVSASYTFTPLGDTTAISVILTGTCDAPPSCIGGADLQEGNQVIIVVDSALGGEAILGLQIDVQ
jgi:hypothetical protein